MTSNISAHITPCPPTVIVENCFVERLGLLGNDSVPIEVGHMRGLVLKVLAKGSLPHPTTIVRTGPRITHL